MFTKILSLDLGTNTGWSLEANGVVTCGSENFKATRFESVGMRYLKFRRWIVEMIKVQKPEIVVYEQIHRHLGTAASHVYGGLLGQLQAECEDKKIPYKGIDVGKIKKTATGNGAADKFMMINAAKKKWPDLQIVDSDTADSLWILETAKNQI